jgi:hypothetical protein
VAVFNFGQPLNGYCQLGFVVLDIRDAMESFTVHMAQILGFSWTI